MTILQTAYLAPRGLEGLLLAELKNVAAVYDRLIIAEGAPQDVYWVQNIWFDPQIITIQSISNATQALRTLQRNWWPYEFKNFRRMRLIQQKLPYISAKALDFLGTIPSAPLGSWTLIDTTTLLASPHCSSPMPHGEWRFNEDKINPPSRAYLKLWEFFTRFRSYPTKHDTCIDLGASPGGWTWVLAQLAKKVISFDRSPLDARLHELKNIEFNNHDAFKVNLAEYPEASWIFSDVICYPEKLFEFVKNLLEKFPDKKYVFTIKFQGDDNKNIIEKFASLPGKIIHLSQNKHELTWYKI